MTLAISLELYFGWGGGPRGPDPSQQYPRPGYEIDEGPVRLALCSITCLEFILYQYTLYLPNDRG